jgi:lipoprotein-anchoring transpeptidase ErfK/SrfK
MALASSSSAQFRLFGPRSPKPTPQPKMRKASAYISRQEPLKVNQSVLNQATPDNVHVRVSLPKQRAYLMVGEEIAADSPISSGRAGHSTPSGHFSVLEKDPDHRSSIYGDFVDRSGRVVRAGISAKIDSAPSGTHYVGASMRWFMRLTGEGVGMHVGILPGYPASHGCVRMSADGAKLFYDHVKIGTPVAVGD